MKEEYRKKRRWKRRIFQVMLCSLFFTGCGQGALEDGIEKGTEYLEEGIKEETEEVFYDKEETEDVFYNMEQYSFQTEKGNAYVIGKAALEQLIEDAGFRERVWYDADLKDEDTRKEILQKLEQCESLVLKESLYGNATFSLEGLKLLPNLKRLIIEFDEWDDSKIEDFTPIAELSQLEELYFSYGVEEVDLSFLAEMKTITNLFLPRCQIADFTFLGEMPQLKRLSLYYTVIEDLSVLEKLPELVELALAGNEEAKHIEVIGTLAKMEDLGLQYCGITDIRFLSSLTELRGVNLNGNFVSDLTPIAGLAKLERLGLAENKISDISPIADLSNLFDLSLDRNEICDISVLSNIPRLNQVGLSDNQIQDLSPLTDKEELMYVSVYGNPCLDLKPVWQVPLLYFSNKEVSDAQRERVDQWITKYKPEMGEYECIDYAEGDLNQDGRLDAAFVVNGIFRGEDNEYTYSEERQLIILLQQQDGSWMEMEHMISMESAYSGGMRGDPYRGIFMGEGYLMKKNEWGSRYGCKETDVYFYQQGEMKCLLDITISDDIYIDEYDVQIRNEVEGIKVQYRIVMEEYRMVKKEISDLE